VRRRTRASRLARSRKARNGTELLCEHAFRPLAHVVVLALAPLRVPPPAVVLAAAVAGIAGGVELARGHLLIAALLLQLKTILDNADGQLARLTGRVTLLGRYLDCESDLLVDAALFTALGWYTDRPLTAAVGFALLTVVSSVNFNVERLSRGAVATLEPYPFLARAYALLYGWQDRLLDRLLGDGRVAPRHASVMANLGLSTQLALFGVFLALGRPLEYVWLLVAQAAFVLVIFSLVHSNQEVSVEHH